MGVIRSAWWLASVAGLLSIAPTPPRWQVTELGRSVDSGWPSPQVLTCGTAAEFHAAWAVLYPNAGMRPPLPVVDFAATRVMVMAAGSRPTGGFDLRLDTGRVAGDTAWITVVLHTPVKGCGVVEQLTHPAVALALPREPAVVRFITQERPGTGHC